MDHDEMRAAMRRATEPQVVIHSDPDGRWVLWQADCRNILSRLPDNCVDAVVTDPPYGLEFMGKEWDSFSPEPVVKRSGHDKAAGGGFSETANGSKLPNYGGTKTFECAGCGRRDAFRKKCKCENPSWMRVNVHGNLQALAFQEWTTSWAREALRVLKPGGHLLAFGGSRTYHRLACAVEDAGFEIRDQIMWVYGSGFPKSLDVSKAIDKRGGYPHLAAEIGKALKQARIDRGITIREADVMFCDGTTNWSWFEGRPRGQRAPTPETFTRIVEKWPELSHLKELVDEAEREVVGTASVPEGHAFAGPTYGGDSSNKDVPITTPATDAAKQWQGWGTALKPAHEPIVVARKPLEGTVAANVLKWGTGALNIDGARVPSGDNENFVRPANHTNRHEGWQRPWHTNPHALEREKKQKEKSAEKADELGRWPANFIHDGSDEVLALFPDTKAGVARTGHPGGNTFGGTPMGDDVVGTWYGDAGSAARFFYCAKASKAERNVGLGHLDDRLGGSLEGGNDKRNGDTPQLKPTKNHHPTVKPIALMRYLIRLVTPPGGVVLDPFAGSGTTMVAALMEGVTPWGCEMTADYVPIILGRVGWALDEVESRIEGTL